MRHIQFAIALPATIISSTWRRPSVYTWMRAAIYLSMSAVALSSPTLILNEKYYVNQRALQLILANLITALGMFCAYIFSELLAQQTQTMYLNIQDRLHTKGLSGLIPNVFNKVMLFHLLTIVISLLITVSLIAPDYLRIMKALERYENTMKILLLNSFFWFTAFTYYGAQNHIVSPIITSIGKRLPTLFQSQNNAPPTAEQTPETQHHAQVSLAQ